VHREPGRPPPLGKRVDLRFNDIWTDGPLGTRFLGEDNIFVGPLFCDSPGGDHSLQECSPCIGAGEDGSDIGALGMGCECITSVEAMSWGAIKALFR